MVDDNSNTSTANNGCLVWAMCLSLALAIALLQRWGFDRAGFLYIAGSAWDKNTGGAK